jgi:membrane protease YdiL (CAAX protease family)
VSSQADLWYLGGVKRCDYCGKEYPDDVAVCTIDRNPLLDISGLKEKELVPPPYRERTDSDLVYPEYRWSARDGWKFIGMITVFGVMWLGVMGTLFRFFPSFYPWRWQPYGYVIVRCATIAICLLTAAYFARTETWAAFCEACGLNKRPSQYVWFGVAFAFCLRLLGHFFHTLGWIREYSQVDLRAFETTHGPERYLYLFGLLAAAFVEEPVYRGFLYKAFRGSYAMTPSVMIVLGFTAYTHWAQYQYLGWAVISLSSLAIVQCYLREKSDSLWDCIFCHLVFNGSSLFVSGILRY